VAIHALASVCGGTQTLQTNSRDEALGLPTEKSATIALRTQQIIGYETGVADVVDPMGGSHFVEALTDEIEKRANEYIERIEGMGGVIPCIESGWIQNEIQNASYQFQKDMEAKKEIVVGVNEFIQDEPYPTDILKVSENVSRDQIARLKAFKAKRDPKKIETQLAKLRKAAEGDENLMPLLIESVESHVTLGEIAHELRKVFGLFKESITL
jgi:methylmalonyl-CoA mutase N-terminal domain/subunit